MNDIIAASSAVLNCERCAPPVVQRDTTYNLPQFGYVGELYGDNGAKPSPRVLFVGRNPATIDDRRSSEYYRTLQALQAMERGEISFEEYARIYVFYLRSWHTYRHYIKPILYESGLTLHHAAFANTVNCRTPENMAPHIKVETRCFSHFFNFFELIQPECIVVLGNKTNVTVEKYGLQIPKTVISRERRLRRDKRLKQVNAASEMILRCMDE